MIDKHLLMFFSINMLIVVILKIVCPELLLGADYSSLFNWITVLGIYKLAEI